MSEDRNSASREVIAADVVKAVLAESRARPQHERFAATEWEIRETYASVVRHTLPSQAEMNQAFYVDVCRAEDALMELAKLAQAVLDTLPPHWHDEPVVDLQDAVQAIRALRGKP